MYTPTEEEKQQGYYDPPTFYRIAVIICNILCVNLIYKLLGIVLALITLFAVPIILMIIWAATNPLKREDND